MSKIPSWGRAEVVDSGGARVICDHVDGVRQSLVYYPGCDGRWRAICHWCGAVYVHVLMGRELPGEGSSDHKLQP